MVRHPMSNLSMIKLIYMSVITTVVVTVGMSNDFALSYINVYPLRRISKSSWVIIPLRFGAAP